MLFSSSRFNAHEEVAYHWNGGAAQDILEITRSKGGQVKEVLEGHFAQQRIETQQGCPLKEQGL
jgi:hypothetical protein